MVDESDGSGARKASGGPAKILAWLVVAGVIFAAISMLGHANNQTTRGADDWRAGTNCHAASDSPECMEAWAAYRRRQELVKELDREGFFDSDR
jgi:hypothetical protein